jgi:hypothetical protein
MSKGLANFFLFFFYFVISFNKGYIKIGEPLTAPKIFIENCPE